MATYYVFTTSMLWRRLLPLKLTVVMPISCLLPCADPGIFVRGGGGGVYVNLTKSSDNVFLGVFGVVFFAFFLVLSLFYRSQMVNFKEKYHFSRFRRGFQIFPEGGGGNFFQGGGSNCLFPIETHITCDFPGRGVRTPCPPLDPHLAAIYSVSQSAKWCDRFLQLCLFSCNFVVCFSRAPQ